jgi:hypothetical protein
MVGIFKRSFLKQSSISIIILPPAIRCSNRAPGVDHDSIGVEPDLNRSLPGMRSAGLEVTTVDFRRESGGHGNFRAQWQ